VPRSNEFEQLVKDLTPEVARHKVLPKVPPDVLPQIIRGALVQLKIAHEHKADLIGNMTYKKLCQHIQRAIVDVRSVEIVDPSDTLKSDLQTAFSLSGLHFSLKSLDEFARLRENETLKHYAKNFRKTIRDLPLTNKRESRLLRAMLKAIHSEDIAKQISGGLDVSATAAGYISLIPIIGTIAGITSLASDHAAKIATKVGEKNRWWLLGPEISKTLTVARLEARLRELESK